MEGHPSGAVTQEALAAKDTMGVIRTFSTHCTFALH